MNDLEHCAELILDDINMRTADQNPNQRAMVLLFVAKMIQVVIEMDMVDTYRLKKEEQ